MPLTRKAVTLRRCQDARSSRRFSRASALSLVFSLLATASAGVQPVFVTKRPGHTRCVLCHSVNNAPFHLVPLSPGATTWNEEQSRQNFELVKRVAMPGYLESKLIKHPLAEEAGGDAHHGGAQQFASQQDPDWVTLKAFVMGETAK